MRLTLLKWYFYSIIKLKKLKIRKTMIDTVHYDKYPLAELRTDVIEKKIKVNCPQCIEIISAPRQDV